MVIEKLKEMLNYTTEKNRARIILALKRFANYDSSSYLSI